MACPLVGVLVEVLDELGEGFPLLGLLSGILEPLTAVLFFLGFLERFIAFADAFETGYALDTYTGQ